MKINLLGSSFGAQEPAVEQVIAEVKAPMPRAERRKPSPPQQAKPVASKPKAPAQNKPLPPQQPRIVAPKPQPQRSPKHPPPSQPRLSEPPRPRVETKPRLDFQEFDTQPHVLPAAKVFELLTDTEPSDLVVQQVEPDRPGPAELLRRALHVDLFRK